MLSEQYVVRVIEKSGYFGFHTNQTKILGRKLIRMKVPVFSLILPIEEKLLLEEVRDYFGLKNKVYVNKAYTKDGLQRKPRSVLHIRALGSTKNIIMPFLCKNLRRTKLQEMEAWLDEIARSEFVNESYKLIPKLYNSGYWN